MTQIPHLNSKNKFKDFTLFVSRKKFLIFFIVLIGICTTYFYTKTTPPRYKASAQILIEKNNISNEINIIQSRPMAHKVIDQLNLMNDVEFNSTLPKTDQKTLPQKDDGAFKALSIYKSKIKNEQIIAVSPETNLLIDQFLKNLDVTAIGKSNIAQISFISPYPDKAALIANTMVNVYNDQNKSTGLVQNIRPPKDVQNKLQKIRDQIDALENRIAAVNSPKQKNELDTRKKTSPTLQSLKSKQADMTNQISALSLRYGPKHPTMISKKLEQASLQDQINQERLLMEDTKTLPEKITQDHSKHRALMRDLAANKSLLNQLSKIEQKTQSSPAVRIISYAAVPTQPFYPNTVLLIALSFPLSLLIGLLIAQLIEKMDRSYKTAQELEQDTNLPCLSLIPFIDDFDPNKPVADYILNKSGLRIAEAIRTLRMVLNLRAQSIDQKSQVVTITSSLPDEGKTTLSAWMGRIAAKSGEKVIILDCDLRRPRLHEAFGQKPDNTIVEYLTGHCTLAQATHRDHGTNTHTIFARSVPNNALDLLTKDAMQDLISALKKQYDLIILDTPACLSVSDARYLSAQSDQTLYAVSWKDTKKEVVNAGLKQFADIGCDAVTLVMTNVDLNQYAKYSFNDAIHYYSQYNSYYAD